MASLNISVDETQDAGGDGAHDVLNPDTFGDYAVGDDWRPTAEHEAFAREHELLRTSPGGAATVAAPGVALPPGLDLPTKVSAPDLGAGAAGLLPPDPDTPYKIPLTGLLGAAATSPCPALVPPAGYPRWPPGHGPATLHPGLPAPPSPLASPMGVRAGLVGPPSPSVLPLSPVGMPYLPGVAGPHPGLLGHLGMPPVLPPPGGGLFGTSPFECPDPRLPPGFPSSLPRGPASTPLMGSYLAATAPPLGVAQPSPPRTPPGAPLPLLSALEGVLPASMGGPGQKSGRMLSVAELEAQMLHTATPHAAADLPAAGLHQAVPASVASASGFGALAPADGAPQQPPPVPAGEVPAYVSASAVPGAVPPRPEDGESVVATPAPIAPFTGAHRALLGAEPPGSRAVRHFLREVNHSRSHPSFMTGSDKELIVRIQLSQIAAVGGQSPVQNYRGAFMSRNRKLASQSENVRPAENQEHHPAGALVTRLKESISTAHTEAAADEAAHDEGPSGAAGEPAHAPAAREAPPPEPANPGGQEGCEAAEAKQGAAAAEAGAKSDRRFGSPAYASVHHPRRSLDVPRSGEADAGEAPPAEEAAGAEAAGGEGEAAPAAPLGASGFWRGQLAIEQAFEELLDLELLTHRLAECHPLDAEKQERLASERGRALESLGERLLGAPQATAATGGEAGGEAGGASGSAPPREPPREPPLARILGRRKGRSLVQRVLLSTLPPAPAPAERGRAENAGLVAPLLWRLVIALLGAAPPQLWAAGDTAEGQDGWHKLRLALLHTVEGACSEAEAGRQRSCTDALAVLLRGANRHHVEAVCLSRSGVALVRQLVKGCGGGHTQNAVEIESIMDELIESICVVLPRLYDVAHRTGSSVVAPATIDTLQANSSGEADSLTQEDLWAMLIAITEQASVRQKRHIHGLIGAFVSRVTTAGE